MRKRVQGQDSQHTHDGTRRIEGTEYPGVMSDIDDASRPKETEPDQRNLFQDSVRRSGHVIAAYLAKKRMIGLLYRNVERRREQPGTR